MADQPEDSDDSLESTITYEEPESAPEPPKFVVSRKYVLSVKNTFGDNGEEYLHFLAVLKDLGTERISARVAIASLKALFFEHQELIEEFNQFLPEGFQIALPLIRRPDTNFRETIRYVNKVKAAFSEEEERYVYFLKLLTGFKESGMSVQELSEQMCELFYDRQDLLEEFYDYMPPSRKAWQ